MLSFSPLVLIHPPPVPSPTTNTFSLSPLVGCASIGEARKYWAKEMGVPGQNRQWKRFEYPFLPVPPYLVQQFPSSSHPLPTPPVPASVQSLFPWLGWDGRTSALSFSMQPPNPHPRTPFLGGPSIALIVSNQIWFNLEPFQPIFD